MNSAFRFDKDSHTYHFGETRLPSVTQIIHAAFPDAYRFARLEDVEFKRTVGDAVHAATHYFDEGDLDVSTLDPRVLPYVEGYKRFVVEMGYEPITCEHRMYSERYGYAGTVDKIGVMRNGRRKGCVLVDLKCTAAVSALVPLQTIAYSLLCGDEGIAIDHRACLHLRDDGTYKLHWHDQHFGDQAGFLGCLNRFKWAERAGLNKEENKS